jgi:hypothetical protein
MKEETVDKIVAYLMARGECLLDNNGIDPKVAEYMAWDIIKIIDPTAERQYPIHCKQCNWKIVSKSEYKNVFIHEENCPNKKKVWDEHKGNWTEEI